MSEEKIKQLMSLALLLNVKTDYLVSKAKLVQPGLERIEDVSENAYYFIVGTLLANHDIEVNV